MFTFRSFVKDRKDSSAASLYGSWSWRTTRHISTSFPQSYAAISLLPRLALSYRWLQKVERAGLGRRLSKLSPEEYRTSDTIFVLGTGASINDYPETWWRLIRNHDSVGMNYFLLHPHVPTFHVTEDTDETSRRLLSERYVVRGDYCGTPLVIKTQLTNLSPSRVATRIRDISNFHSDVLANTYLSVDLLAAGRSIEHMERSYRLTHQLGLWRPKSRFLMLTKRRGSLSYVINFAVRCGYRRIVLCGVDLNHTAYFFDGRRDDLVAEGLPVPVTEELGDVHSTNDPAKHPVTIRDVILTIARTILQPAGIQLFVGSDSSALYPELPRFDWEGTTGHGFS